MSDRIDELAEVAHRSFVCTTCAPSDDDQRCQECNAVTDLVTIARETEARAFKADAYEEQRKRADFFRDALDALHECPPRYLDYPCKGRKGEACPYEGDDGIPGYAACWDEVERRQR